MYWIYLMTDWLWWESVWVKERKESGRNVRFSFCAALATWSRDISSPWELSQKNKYGLEEGEESMSQLWIWWLELHLVGSWKYRCGAPEKGWCWKCVIRSYHNRKFSWSQEGRCGHPGRRWKRRRAINRVGSQQFMGEWKETGKEQTGGKGAPSPGPLHKASDCICLQAWQSNNSCWWAELLADHRFCFAPDTGNCKAPLKIWKQKAAFVEFESQLMNKALRWV